MSRSLIIPELLRRAQQTASNPRASAWVSANAGSGKTYVLTQRVLRLLLEGAPPGQILGLTFTKAAAANMATRIFRTLSEWTNLSDEKLAEAITAAGAEPPKPHDLTFARQLFARAIETPGGLKIQTLHAFCERLLQLFPFEANVPAHFKVVDEREAAELMAEARDRAVGALESSVEEASALVFAARESGVFKFDALLAEAQGFADVFDAFDESASFAAALRRRLGLRPGATAASFETEMLGGDIGRKHRQAWAQTLDLGKPKDREIAASLRAADRVHDLSARVDALLAAFFTDKGKPRGGGSGYITTKCLRDDFPGLDDDLHREQGRLDLLRERRRAALTVERSEALFVVAKAMLSAFTKAKSDRGALDFDDQIARALALVTRSSAAWVLHKLDYGLNHLLVDEAQDTSSPQWGILEALSAEFFAGAGARGDKRTVFAVGDEKQSIFSFQGAAPEKFAEMRRFFEGRHRDAEQPFNAVPLNFSFRSSQVILDAVDRTFRTGTAWTGVASDGEPPPLHRAVRSDMKGVVELWPPVIAAEKRELEDWRMPLDEPARGSPAVTLAGRIARTIQGWVAPASRERILDERSRFPRRIQPGDIMILVRSRNAFFEAMIRALKSAHIKVAGADRLMLRDHIAVMDLIAAGRAALLPDDDLTLACVLKSPLVGLTEDELFALAVGRRGSLAGALLGAEDNPAKAAARRLTSWRTRAKTLSPFTFYARLLGGDGGRRALLGRLGPDAAEPIDEFLALALDHERREAPSLIRFLAEIEATDAAIKRDMEAESDGVRVLTVHASKGLEAPIVFLPDTCGAPDGRHDPKLLSLVSAHAHEPRLFAWTRKVADDCEAVAKARADWREAEVGEHRRLLYVGMTRAAQRLVVAGFETSASRAEGCWHNLVQQGLSDALTSAPAPWNAADTILRFGEGLVSDDGEDAVSMTVPIAPPAWLTAPASPEREDAALRPSQAYTAHGGGGESLRVVEGRLAHALLQMLPELTPERRVGAAHAYLAVHGRALDEAKRDALALQAIATIEAPELKAMFGPGSQSEAPIAGVLRRPGRPDLHYSGRLDRLLVTDEAISIVDFKIGAAQIKPSPAHVAQLAIYRAALQLLYPSLPVRVALIYLDGPTVAPVDAAALDMALDLLEET